MDESLELLELEREFCPPFDQALIHAMWNEHIAEGLHCVDVDEQVRQMLNLLKEDAVAQLQQSDFDPSGSSGDRHQTGRNHHCIAEVDFTSNSEKAEKAVSQTDEDSLDSGCFKASEYLDAPTKEQVLRETFKDLRSELVVHILQKCNGNLSKATDELLNYVYFEGMQSSPNDDIVVPRGVDAFSEDHHVPQRSKKGKGKGKRKQNQRKTSYDTSESGVSTPSSNKWLHGTQHIDFIASRTNIPSATISSIYHRNSASVPATIMALVDKDLAEKNNTAQEPDEEVVNQALQLIEDFPSIEFDYAVALVRITSPSLSNARELAKATVTQPATSEKTKAFVDISPRYTPIQVSDASSENASLPSLPPSARPHSTASASAASNAAFTQANAAFRRGKSDPYMKLVAGYYSQVGRELHANVKALSEIEADNLVNSQSSREFLDLHGVSVMSATRIAKAKTQAWWDGLGEARIPGGGRSGVGQGYRIVTGLGRHSEGGRAKIGPAVVRALVKEGWKVEVGTGEIHVMGLARRK